ncbi:uncharacterized protein LOC108435856 [Pygocentrus nattereri]|uniref:uncharacterized protein LOC108435856 n=1 Tax=Pygocentrus nattereri TaxID=42514 RepID=UPI00081444D1|nr:uncharacterized protein LOC108435856 [Pygocentrus nattereri]
MRRVTANFIIYWMSTTVFGKEIKLTASNVNVTCLERVVLQCNITSPQPVEVISMAYKACNHTTSNPQCEYTENKSLTYTIPHATPADAGQYTCTVEAKEGLGFARSTVTVGDCEVQVLGQVEGNQVQCSFSGVYTKGEVHWFNSTQNITSDIPDEIVKDQRGLFNISSTLSIPDIQQQHQYYCSLWIPREGYVTSYVPISSMDKNKLSWILMFLCLILSYGLLKTE